MFKVNPVYYFSCSGRGVIIDILVQLVKFVQWHSFGKAILSSDGQAVLPINFAWSHVKF